jgi:hypothetical protein
MRQSSYILIAMSFALWSCKDRTHTNMPVTFVDTTKSFKKEIPKYQSGEADIFYKLAKTKGKQLGLDSLENGFDNLQIRVWYDFSFVSDRKLVSIKNSDTNWTATIYALQVDWDGRTETILSKTVKQVSPKSGWASFTTKLLDLKVLTLPDQNDIPGCYIGADGCSYNVEVATKNQYRFYGYWEPQMYQNKFWQTKSMADILKLFEEELGVLQFAQPQHK